MFSVDGTRLGHVRITGYIIVPKVERDRDSLYY